MRVFSLLFLLAAGCDMAKSDGKSKDPTIIHGARELRAQLEIQKLEVELDQYHSMRGKWPEDWRAIRRSGKDPWGSDYLIDIEEEGAVVFSIGPDGEEGTGDDIYYYEE